MKNIAKECEEMKLQVSKLSGVIKNRNKTDAELKKSMMQHIDTVEKKGKEQVNALSLNLNDKI